MVDQSGPTQGKCLLSYILSSFQSSVLIAVIFILFSEEKLSFAKDKSSFLSQMILIYQGKINSNDIDGGNSCKSISNQW